MLEAAKKLGIAVVTLQGHVAKKTFAAPRSGGACSAPCATTAAALEPFDGSDFCRIS